MSAYITVIKLGKILKITQQAYYHAHIEFCIIFAINKKTDKVANKFPV